MAVVVVYATAAANVITSLLMAKKIIKQPTVDEQRMLKAVTSAEESYVLVRGKKWKVEWVRNITLDHISRVMLEKNKSIGADIVGEEAEADAIREAYDKNPMKVGAEENKVACKCAALLSLNGYWGIRFLYWFVWRWYYYIKQYEMREFEEFFEECKKKVPVVNYLMSTISLTEMMDTKKQMNRAEVNRIRAAQLSAQREALTKTTQS